MGALDYIVPFVVGLGLLILIHELGHYSVARLCNVKVLRFSVGFGKPLLKWHAGRDRTEWVLALFPLGGYVKMLDEREGEVPEHLRHRAFNTQSVWRRFAIVAAGPLANLALAVLLYWVVFVAGVNELRPRIAVTAPDTIAASAGLRDGDEILSVNGVSVQSWQDWRWAVLKSVMNEPAASVSVRSTDGETATYALPLDGVVVDEGQDDPMTQIGVRPFRPPIPAVVGSIMAGGAAEAAGLRVGDRVVAIDGAPIADFMDLVDIVSKAPGKTLDFEVRRGGQTLNVDLAPKPEQVDGRTLGRIGVGVQRPAGDSTSMFVKVAYPPLEAFGRAVHQTWDMSTFSLAMIGRMVTGELSWRNLSGPVTIADYAGQSAKMGLDHYIKFLALISISLGVLNLLPIPVLDGGHLLYYVLEILRGGPVPERVMEIGQQIGLALLVMLMAFAFYNDINRLISG
ncbi:RIP metalloprotease RseP [Nitrogeniibacter mangrovi]|uniref:Zinc metalloprotease n=1 Tax=Nitrogeniibacter mangrovi TaxID=2016596 RepID=A0A6C1B319_9RHOO|nr:RIP metalloprotease RseP [Nitrogeniibacter mangrovi]QID18026.1 RIP metalloprotease RseP [Nitrogeniibacter mangrovi]